MRAEAYQKLHEFNLHIEQGVAALRELARVKEVSAGEVQQIAEALEEVRTDACSYLTQIFSDQEADESGRLSSKRRRREMAEDPMHGGWLEEERAKKQLKQLQKNKQKKKRVAQPPSGGCA